MSEKEYLHLWEMTKDICGANPQDDINAGPFYSVCLRFWLGGKLRENISLKVNSKQLESPKLFFRKLREKFDLLVDPPTQREWNDYLRLLLEGCDADIPIQARP